MIAATNRPQQLAVYNVATGKILASIALDQEALAARFIPQQKQLLVLTAAQHVYRLDLANLTTGTEVSSHLQEQALADHSAHSPR
jgi:hypothetical protein